MNSREHSEPRRRKRSMASRPLASSENGVQQVTDYLKQNWKTIFLQQKILKMSCYATVLEGKGHHFDASVKIVVRAAQLSRCITVINNRQHLAL